MFIEEYVASKDDKRQVSDHWMRKKVDGAIYMKPAGCRLDAVAVVGEDLAEMMIILAITQNLFAFYLYNFQVHVHVIYTSTAVRYF